MDGAIAKVFDYKHEVQGSNFFIAIHLCGGLA